MMISPPSALAAVTVPAPIPGAQIRWMKNLARIMRASVASVTGLDRGARLLALDAARANAAQVKAIKARMTRAQMERAMVVARSLAADPDMALISDSFEISLRFWSKQ